MELNANEINKSIHLRNSCMLQLIVGMAEDLEK